MLKPNQETIKIKDNILQRFDSKYIKSQAIWYNTNVLRETDLIKEENSDMREYDSLCKKITPEIAKDKLYLDAIFQTYDDPYSKHIAQDPHFDRIPTLKFMLYVNSLKYENGAFCLSPGSHHWTRELLGTRREAYGAKGFLEASRQIPSYIKDKIIPIEGESGMIIIFDTDCIHHQGIVRAGNACIIRAHYRSVKTRSLIRQKFFKISHQIINSALNWHWFIKWLAP